MGSKRIDVPIMAVAGLLYVVSSVYAVLEAFKQLLFLPSEAYRMPAWSNYWPHVA